MIKDYISLAVRSLAKRRTRTYLTMIGIFIGIAAVVSLIGLGEGLKTAITSQFGFLGADILSIQAAGFNMAGPPGTNSPNPLSDELPEKIAKIRNVDAAFGRLIGTSTIEFNDRQEIGFVMSVPYGENRKTFEEMVNLKVMDGRLLRNEDDKKIVLGFEFSKDAIFGKPIGVGNKMLIKGKPYEVVGILESKGSFLFDSAILMNEKTMRDDVKPDDGNVNIIAVKVKDKDKIAETQDDISKLLRKERDVKLGEEDFSVDTPAKTLETLNSTLFAVQLFVIIIAAISLLVGGIGIMNTMYTAVLERSKEIGIMKSIGARNSTIFLIFFIESGLLGMIGGIIGILLGLSFAYGLAFIGRLALGSDLIQATVSLWLLIGSLAFSFVLGTFFGVLPAYRASRLNPVDSLRKSK